MVSILHHHLVLTSILLSCAKVRLLHVCILLETTIAPYVQAPCDHHGYRTPHVVSGSAGHAGYHQPHTVQGHTVTCNLNTVQGRGQTVTWTQSRGQTVTWAVDNAACSVAGGMLAMLTTPS